MKSTFKILITLLSSALLLSQNSQAYFTTSETGSILEREHWSLLLAPQFITQGSNGFNIITGLNAPLADSSNLMLKMGFGEVDFFTEISLKWIPIPDYESQPAIGVKLSFQYAHLGAYNQFSFGAAPIVSKSFSWEYGNLEPYASLPIHLSFFDQKLLDPVLGFQLSLGLITQFESIEDFEFFVEGNFNLDDSTNSVVFGARYNFDTLVGQMRPQS